jgi:acyl-coenzyme A thioesterase PaaI-like protein
MPLVHHELCFGCGRTNLFGLLAELDETAPHVVSGRCFIKQDHQGAERGFAHDGIVVAALSEAMAFACGPQSRVHQLRIEFSAPVPVGTYLELQADARGLRAGATALVDGTVVARASGTYDR